MKKEKNPNELRSRINQMHWIVTVMYLYVLIKVILPSVLAEQDPVKLVLLGLVTLGIVLGDLYLTMWYAVDLDGVHMCRLLGKKRSLHWQQIERVELYTTKSGPTASTAGRTP